MAEEMILNEDATTLLSDDSKDTKDEVVEDKKSDVTDNDSDEKSGDGEPAKDKDSDADKSDKDVAPEKYEDFTIPEGSVIDDAKLTKFTEVAKDIALSQGDAQKFVDLYASVAKDAVEEQVKAWADVQTKWVTEAKTDGEIGGDKFQETVTLAKSAVRILGNDKLQEALDVTGMGNHPEFIRFASKVGRAIGEDKLSFGSGASEGPKDVAKLLFPNQN